MKAVFCLALITICAVCVTAERCSRPGDCDHMTCDPGHDIDCHNRICTCTDNVQGKCTMQSDCSGSCNRGWHCIDTKCRCGYGTGK